VSGPAITVLVPLIDARGDAAEHIRSWTQEQSLARERYQVIVAAPLGEEELRRRVAEILTEHDKLIVVEQDGLSLYDAAAEVADADWLLPTESHCLGQRVCLAEIVAAIEREPELEAMTLEHGHVVSTSVDRLCARWFGDVYDVWRQPGEWTRLNLVGFAIRRDLYRAEGGLDGRFGLFSSFVLGAKLDQRGVRIPHLAGAQVDHVHTHGIRAHHDHAAEHAYRECDARVIFDTDFCERYFGYSHTWGNALRFHPQVARPTAAALARSVIQAARTRDRALADLSRELLGWLGPALAGVHPHLAMRKLRFLLSELASDRLPLPREIHFSQFMRALHEISQLTQLRWIREHSNGHLPTLAIDGSRPIGELDGVMVATHGLEHHAGQTFRWTEPACSIRVPATGGALRIVTGHLRGPVLDYVRDVYVGDRRVSPGDLREDDGGTLVIPLGGAPRSDPVGQPVSVICEPLLPAREGSSDTRRLGLPVFSLELRAAA
jgi:hypothetical protein